MSFHIHRSNRVEHLVDSLSGLLKEPLGGPLDPEPLVVPGRGMSVWLSMQLSKRLGIWASPVFFPREFLEHVAERVLFEGALRERGISRESIEWAIHAVLPELIERPEFAMLASYLVGDTHGVRFAELCRRLAGVFDQYLTYRPEWARAWEHGILLDVPAEARFQQLLFERVVTWLGRPHLARIEAELTERLAEAKAPPRLPARVCVFGVSTLPPLFVRVLAGLSRHVDVHLFSFSAVGLQRNEREAATQVGAPLRESFEAVAADFVEVLEESLARVDVKPIVHEHHEPANGASVLAALQAALSNDDSEALWSAASESQDRSPSLLVHACHGPMREVEVLHDQLLELMTREHAAIVPEDVVVLIPELETYAPLVDAVFAREPTSANFIPYHVADQPSRSESPVLDAFQRILSMVRGRVTANDVIDLILVDQIRSRFEIEAASVDVLKRWIVESGIRWGIDAEHRASLGLEPTDAHTFRWGFTRLALGYAMPGAGRSTFRDSLPYDEIEGQSAVLLGSFGRLLRVLFGWLRKLETPRPLESWLGTLAEACSELFAEDSDSARAIARIVRALEEVSEAAREARFEGELDVLVVKKLLARAIDEGHPERGFLAGGVTFCAAVPMRSIPFRVVCALGMNDTAFPRASRPVEFDLMRHAGVVARPGDRSVRDDDRYLFLETLCAARERLIITYSGRSLRDSREQPPSVCVSELLDFLREKLGDSAAGRLVIQHHLHGFHPAYFDRSDRRLFSYETAQLRAARSLVREQEAAAPFLANPLAALELQELALDELVRFFRSPPAYFLNRRLGVYLKAEESDVLDREPLELDPLENYRLGDSLLGHLLDGLSLPESERLLRAAGELPLGGWGTLVIADVHAVCCTIVEAVREQRGGSALAPIIVDLELGKGKRLHGVLDGVFQGGLIEHGYWQLRPNRILRAWIRHLCLCATAGPKQSLLIGRDKAKPCLRVFAPLGADVAQAALSELVDLFVEGQTRPVAFLPVPSHDYVRARGGKSASEEAWLAKASDAYLDEHMASGPDPHAERVFGSLLPPFDLAYEEGKKRLEDTEFHKAACAIFEPALEGSRVHDGS